MANENILVATDASFERDVLQSQQPVLVDFWAEWCAPCRAIAPLVAELAAEYPQELRVVKVNTDEYAQAAQRFGVRGLPTLLLFVNGRVAGQRTGAVRKAELVSFVQSALPARADS